MFGQNWLNSFGCDDCDIQFEDIKSFMAHRRIHFAPDPDIQPKGKNIQEGICPHCNLSFYVKTLSPEEVDRLRKPKKLSEVGKKEHFKVRECRYCLICKISFRNANELLIHSKDVHDVERPYKCRKCNFTTSIYHHIKRHSYSHKDKKLYPCHLCPKEYTTKTSLDGHLLIHSEVNIKSYDCEFCGKKFPIPSLLKRHLRTHAPSQKGFKCELCPKEFIWKKSLKLHILTHTGEKPYQCRICQRGFTEPFKYRRHMQVHNQIIGNVIDCEFCGKQFLTPYLLKKHMVVHDNSGVQFICDVCSKPFLREENLNLHKKSHTGDLPYQCDDCGKKFTNRHAYARHRIIHIKPNEDPVTCDHCGKEFPAIYRLERHIKIHTREENDLYKCEICSKSFTRKQTLKDHLLIHEGKEPYSCEHCGKKFLKQRYLKIHLDPDKNSGKLFRCKKCPTTFTNKSCYVFHAMSHKKSPYLHSAVKNHRIKEEAVERDDENVKEKV